MTEAALDISPMTNCTREVVHIFNNPRSALNSAVSLEWGKTTVDGDFFVRRKEVM